MQGMKGDGRTDAPASDVADVLEHVRGEFGISSTTVALASGRPPVTGIVPWPVQRAHGLAP